jgi:hypothetical protein
VDAYNDALSEVVKDLHGKSAVDIMVHTAQQVCMLLLFSYSILPIIEWIYCLSYNALNVVKMNL